MPSDHAFTIDAGKGQFLASFAITVSGKKGSSVNLWFCEVIAGKAVVLAKEQAEASLALLRTLTDTADDFTVVAIEREQVDGAAWCRSA